MGAPEPCENSEGESGATLDLELLCCERGLIDNLRIHESLDEPESRGFSAPAGRELTSLCRMNECLLLVGGGDDI